MLDVGDVAFIDEMPKDQRAAFEETFDITRTTDLDDAIAQVKKGDADVAVEMKGDTLVAHYTQTDQVKAAVTQGVLKAFVDGTNVALSGKPPTYQLEAVQVEDDSLKTIQYVTPGLLGWAVAMSASFGAAATLNGWRNSKLLRRLQLSPVPTSTLVGARVAVTVGDRAHARWRSSSGLGAAFFGLKLTGAWLASIPLLIVGTLCFMAIGLLSGAVAKTTEGAVNMANFIVLPMSFLSGSFFPLDVTPQWLQNLAHVLPLFWLNDGMLDVMVRGESGDRRAAADGGAGRLRGRRHRCRGEAVPLGGRVTRLFLTPEARVRRLRRRVSGDRTSPLAARRVLVTGASSGIGEATATAVADRGATVLLVARREEELERVRAAIEARGGRAAAYVCDLTDFDAVDALVKHVLAEHGCVDYLVNNAGRSIRRSLALSHDRFHDFERTMAVNYFGPVRLTMGLLPSMRAQGFGHVVNIGTWGVQMKAPKFSAYIASKTALDTWSRIAGRETYADGVTFTNIRFGLVQTPMVVPTAAYENRKALTPEQAAIRVVRALEDRPVTVDNLVARVGGALNIVAPRLSDALMNRYDRRFPDS